MVLAPRDLAAKQAALMLAAVEKLRPGSAQRLSDDPFAELTRHDGVAVRLVPDSHTRSGSSSSECSVAGAYVDDADPPVLAVAASASAGRRAFTLLHEFGHHLQRTVLALSDLLLAQPDRGVALEDAACDTFAAEILLPKTLVDRHIDDRGPTADNVVDLWRASSASRAAACVRAAQRLPSPGHVVLLDDAGAVSFSASAGLPPVKRGSSQRGVETVRVAYDGAGRATGRTRLRYRDGILGDELHAQVVPMDGYRLLVAVIDGAPWKTFSLSSREPGPIAKGWICEHPECGHEFRSFEPRCQQCAAPSCPECGRCRCQLRVKERICTDCFQVLPASMFRGASTRCDECS